MAFPLDGLMWLLLVLGPLLFLQRGLHQEIQAVFLLLTRRTDLAVALFSLLFFPGVLLHEASHFLMAKILRVPTGKVSLIPQSIEGNRLRLGFVETGKTDIVRDSLIGMAPLLVGGTFIAYVGIFRLDLLSIWYAIMTGDVSIATDAISMMFATSDFWLWFYLMVAVSSTMFPSPSDRRAWLPLALIIFLVVGIAFFLGAGPWMSENLLPLLNEALRGIAIVFTISAVAHLIVLVPTWIVRKLLNKLTGMEVIRNHKP